MAVVIIDLVCAAVLIGVDQMIKAWATAVLEPAVSMPLIPHIIELRYLLNRGAAFSMLDGKQKLLLVVTGVALCAVAWYLFVRCRKPAMRWVRVALVLILAGGIGNFIDRALNGQVVDYLNFLFIRFPIFNFADICICVGVGIWIFYILFEDSLNGKQKGGDFGHTKG